MDLSKFKTSDWLKVGGGLVFFIAGFLTWWSASFQSLSQDATGLGDYFGTVGLAWLIFTAIAVVTALVALGIIKLPSTFPAPLVFLGASVLALLLVLVRFFSDGFGNTSALENNGVDNSRGAGNWLGTLAALAIVAGCALAFKESGGSLNDIKGDMNKLKSSFGGSSTNDPPPPPPPPPGGMAPPPPPPPPPAP